MVESPLARMTTTAQQFLGRCALEGRELLVNLAGQNGVYANDTTYGRHEALSVLSNFSSRWREACATAIAVATLSYLIYNVYFHPLANFPGPFWARASLVRSIPAKYF
jgi:hypothetical protein